jgi:hypothetical protein
MPEVAQRGWIMIGHDSRHHQEKSEIAAIKQHNAGCFYLWGANATRWEKMRSFLRAYPGMIEADRITPRPYIFRITETGQLSRIPIPF